MPSDFGDESGEKFCDWLLDIGQQAGDEAMRAAAKKLTFALKCTKGEVDENEKPQNEWARLKLDELTQVENYGTIREILDKQLDASGIEHGFFVDDKTGGESLLFKREDARAVAHVFDELIEDVQASLEKAFDTLSKGSDPVKTQKKETSRDSEPLDKRAARARASSKALESERGRSHNRDMGREDKFQEVKTK